MTTRLQLYNGALGPICGERSLASLTENREPRRLLDEVWNAQAVDLCLGAGQWKFAKRTVELQVDTGVTPQFGYALAYAQPDDFIRTCALCVDERLDVPLLTYQAEGTYWYTDTEPVYLSYVSNGASYGGDLSLWPPDFCRYVEAYLASRICFRLTQSKADVKTCHDLMKIALLDAKNGDALEGPTQFLPEQSWSRARGGRGIARTHDGGSRSRLIG